MIPSGVGSIRLRLTVSAGLGFSASSSSPLFSQPGAASPWSMGVGGSMLAASKALTTIQLLISLGPGSEGSPGSQGYLGSSGSTVMVPTEPKRYRRLSQEPPDLTWRPG